MPDFFYIHIPFCIRKCIYCDFFSVPYDESTVKKYVDALCKEIFLRKDTAGTLRTVYIGGGTPTLLPDDCLRKLFRCLKDNYSFSPDIEITVEANPGTIDESKIDTLIFCGVNRISLGVQSLNDAELVTLARIHDSGDAVRSIQMIKEAGIRNLSTDLIYGIPGQTMDSWRDTLSGITNFSPAHISTYELTPEKNTPLYELIKSPHNSLFQSGAKKNFSDMYSENPPLAKEDKGGFSGKITMPDEDLILEMYNHAIEYLAGCGYEHYEISNFSLPGYKCIHNLNYWNRGEYIGAGSGAYSFANGIRSKNSDDIEMYIENLDSGIIILKEKDTITDEEAKKELIFLGLRKTEGLNLRKAEDFGLNLSAVSSGLIDEGYLEIEKGHLRLTRKGTVISNTVIVTLFEKLGLEN